MRDTLAPPSLGPIITLRNSLASAPYRLLRGMINSKLSMSQPVPILDLDSPPTKQQLPPSISTPNTAERSRIAPIQGLAAAELPPFTARPSEPDRIRFAGTPTGGAKPPVAPRGSDLSTPSSRALAGFEAFQHKLSSGVSLQLQPIYLEALSRASVIPTVGGVLQKQTLPAHAQSKLRPLPTPPATAPPPRGLSGCRHTLKQFREQRRQEGSASNTLPGRAPVEVSIPLTVREEFPSIASAAEEFNLRHRMRTRTTTALLTGLSHDPTSDRLRDEYSSRLDEIRRNRFFLPDKSLSSQGVESLELSAKRQSALRAKLHRQHRWQLDSSVWLPRKQRGNSHDYFETEAAIRTMFAADWELASRARRGFIQKLIIQHDDGGGGDEEGEDEVQDVRSTLERHARMLYTAFEYYSVSDVGATNASGIDAQHEIHDLTLSGFLAFARDCELASAECPTRVLEIIFSQVDAADQETLADDPFNRGKALDRQEFFQCMIRIALERHVKCKQIVDVSDAVEKVCKDIAARLPDRARQDSNTFREKYCYSREMDKVLRRHLKLLNQLFTRYSDLAEGAGDAKLEVLDSSSMMSIREWMAMINHLGFFQSGQLSFYEAKLLFIWSRIRTAKDNSKSSLTRMRNLYFEDFMEAIIRLSMLVALPTNEDLGELEMSDAGEYLLSLAHDSPSLYRSFLRDRKGSFLGPPRQHIWLCTDHLLKYLKRLLGVNVGPRPTGQARKMSTELSDRHVTNFARQRTRGVELVFVPDDAGRVGDETPSPRQTKSHAAGMRAVKERLLGSLRNVKQLITWPEHRLLKLLGCMSDAPFAEGEFIFRQDEPGDAFFVIVSGKADVIRVDPDTGTVSRLAQLVEGAAFGERALLLAEPRYASVQAASKLHTLSISRTVFEKCFGRLEASMKNFFIPMQADRDAEESQGLSSSEPLHAGACAGVDATDTLNKGQHRHEHTEVQA